jgi:hypothetical protein
MYKVQGSLTIRAFILFCAFTTLVSAQVLEAVDDLYGIPFGITLEVEPFGVLENDLLDGENAGESGATAVLVSDVSHGTLNFFSDGSFTYSVGAGFAGSDHFIYRAEFGSVSDEATVVLSACKGGPDLYTCWDETAFYDKVQELGFPIYQEGFEDESIWGHVRAPLSAASVVSQGIEWRSNHPDPPASNPISTTSGPPHSGLWAIDDPYHGYATGYPNECDVDNPPEHCLYHDGVTGIRVPGQEALHGVGGWFDGFYGARVAIFIDGVGPYGGGHLTYAHQFFGIIDARPAGFTEFQFREMDGKIGQALYIFGDDISIVGEAPTSIPEQESFDAFTLVSPNPTRGPTNLRFSLDSPASLKLNIYDISGRLVRSLSDAYRSAGSHEIEWNLRDGAGRKVSSGVYFARLHADRAGVRSMSSYKLVVID